MLIFYLSIFAVSCLLLFWSGSRLIKALIKIARYLNWREFTVAFFIMAAAATLPNLFVGIDSALHGIPELSFGDVVGGNIVDLTIAVALSVLIGGATLSTRSRTVQVSAIFAVAVAVLPLFLILDGALGRGDGLILLSAFLFYIFWIFSKEERFKRIYNKKANNHNVTFKGFLKNFRKVFTSLAILLIASEAIVRSAKVMAGFLDISISIVGILIVGFGNALPEIYFSIVSAVKKQGKMILGDLLGSVIICSTLVLGVVALIHPVEINDFSPFAIARIFLVISVVFFFFAVKTDKKITKKEAFLLLLIYILFIAAEIYFRK